MSEVLATMVQVARIAYKSVLRRRASRISATPSRHEQRYATAVLSASLVSPHRAVRTRMLVYPRWRERGRLSGCQARRRPRGERRYEDFCAQRALTGAARYRSQLIRHEFITDASFTAHSVAARHLPGLHRPTGPVIVPERKCSEAAGQARTNSMKLNQTALATPTP